MIKFKWAGSMRVGFADLGREVGPDEEFDVPEHLALSFAEHGLCTCLEPEKLEPLRAAAAAQEKAQQDARDAAGLAYAHPAAAAAAAERAAARARAATSAAAPMVDEQLPEPEPAPPAASSKRTKTDQPSAAAAK